MNAKKAVIIVAGGKGMRMQTDIPKQFIVIGGLPVLMHTLMRFHSFDDDLEIVLVLPTNQVDYWKDLCLKYHFTVLHKLVAGGDTRFQSVRNGLQQVSDVQLVAIHDGVRPLVSHDTIKRCFDAALVSDAAIPVAECVESLRKLKGTTSRSVDRSQYKLVQTPQVFERKLLLEAYKQALSPIFTDDASVIENYFSSHPTENNRQITLVEGNRENIKITTPLDLKIAQALLES